jgi:hypothetical protein
MVSINISNFSVGWILEAKHCLIAQLLESQLAKALWDDKIVDFLRYLEILISMPDDDTVRVILLLDLGVLLNIIEHLDDVHASIILVGLERILHVLPRIVILLIDGFKQAFL